ncbi:hypothetical protein NDU88_001913 [Pleurodeles waltl]|uniref:Uncharacterized protein n=1 Tax=Pleurodeles waltl TaxID=8319 RepID=A0AAV7VXS0_PLEWA|nr:hypothetical protein NDU88_001913 [Pleurodeles waltl]
MRLRPFLGPSAKTWGHAVRLSNPTETEAEWPVAGECPTRQWAAKGRNPEGLVSWDIAADALRLLKVHSTQWKKMACMKAPAETRPVDGESLGSLRPAGKECLRL